tara:strand:+ start:1946 stop:2083 length:138 start_codon:yes stop_codon:yes gene_type:complete
MDNITFVIVAGGVIIYIMAAYLERITNASSSRNNGLRQIRRGAVA